MGVSVVVPDRSDVAARPEFKGSKGAGSGDARQFAEPPPERERLLGGASKRELFGARAGSKAERSSRGRVAEQLPESGRDRGRVVAIHHSPFLSVAHPLGWSSHASRPDRTAA